MGAFTSKQPPPPAPPLPPSPLLPEPWRTLDWGKRDEMKEHVRRFKIRAPGVKFLRILVYGPVGAGKSTFINSIDHIFQERMTSGAAAEAATDKSCTKTFRAHKIKDGKYGTYLPFVMCDIMGLERGDNAGVQTEDLINILEGHIEDDYVFNPTSPWSCKKKGYNKDLKHKIHCLVSVIPADTLLWCADKGKVSDYATRELDEAYIKKLQTIRERANFLGIPHVVILSKVDEACPKVKEDVKLIYRSIVMHKKVKHCSSNVGVPLNYIFPVKNYHEEIHLNNDIDVLLLSALTNILNFANDHVADIAEREKRGLKFPFRMF